MANELQNSLLAAIDTVVGKRIEELELDKTIVASIEKCVNADIGQYRVQYQGGSIIAYSKGEEIYSPNTSVYVTVPQNDFSQKKWILGRTSNVVKDQTKTQIGSRLSDFQQMGDNVISSLSKDPFFLCSHKGKESKTLYKYSNQENNMLEVNQEKLQTYIKEGEAVLLRASFCTQLSPEQQMKSSAKYGITFTLAFNSSETNDLEYKRIFYDLNSNEMIGNPFLFEKYMSQYDICAVDSENFSHIEEIVFSCEGFNETENKETNDIFVKNIEFCVLRENKAKSGDYRLTLDFSEGLIFAENDNSTISVKANFMLKNELFQDNVKCYWFVKDGRVNSVENENYSVKGGIGWRQISSDEQDSFKLMVQKNTNLLPENYYKCVCIYNDVITLKSEFKLFNKESEKPTVKIESKTQIDFKLDRGTAVLVCQIITSEGQEENPDDYDFLWVKKDSSELSTICKNTSENIEELKNVFEFPAHEIPADDYVVIECYVCKETSFLGFDSIILKNETTTSASDYYIVIENDGQSFKYNKYGVSPCSEQYMDPVVPLNLICHLYDLTDTEIDSSKYSVSWEYPSSDSLLVIPEEAQNSNVGIFKIENIYDDKKTNNQITCVVTCKENDNTQTIRKNTSLVFGKDGDNKTIGSDLHLKIKPAIEGFPENELLTTINGNWSAETNSDNNKNPFEAIVYKQGVKVEETIVPEWNVVQNNQIIDISENYDKNESFLVRAIAKTNIDESAEKILYGFYPVCAINYEEGYNEDNFPISINKAATLKEIVYDSNGYNPQYNKNQGAGLILPDEHEVTVSWEACGEFGFNIPEKANPSFVNILPKTFYSGEQRSNFIRAKISKENEDTTTTVIANVYIPFYIHLDRNPLSFLDSWDGNSVSVNNKCYVLAPQVGAGIKEEDNSFTGILMGTEKTVSENDETDRRIGLLGYKAGKQTIFLNAETGETTLGTSGKGQIILNPDGDSSIAGWTFNENSLYKILKENDEASEEDDAAIILTSDPPSFLVKGKADNSEGGDGVSYGVDLNPMSDDSVFKILKYNNEGVSETIAGIDSFGHFYSNSNTIKSGNTNFTVQEGLSGFGKGGWVGGTIEIDESILMKMFTDKTEQQNTTILHISGGGPYGDYGRPVNLHGKWIGLYAGEDSKDDAESQETTNSIRISTNRCIVGYEESAGSGEMVAGLVINKDSTSEFDLLKSSRNLNIEANAVFVNTGLSASDFSFSESKESPMLYQTNNYNESVTSFSSTDVWAHVNKLYDALVVAQNKIKTLEQEIETLKA